MKQEGGIASVIGGAFRYHRIVLLLVAILVGLGIAGLAVMPKQEFPEFTVRQGLVVGVYPGATSPQVEEQLTKPLENFIFSYKEVNRKKTFSQSRDGMVFVNVELNDDVKDNDQFWSKFKLGIQAFKSSLPAGVIALQVNDDFGDTSALLITLESKDKTYRELEKYLENLEDRLRTIESVSALRRYGIQKEQIGVYLDQQKLSQYGIGPVSLAQKLFSQGFTTLSGKVDNHRFVAPVHVADPYDWVRDVSQQIVYSDPQGNVIRLKDVAEIKREYPDPDSYIQNNEVKCILLSMEMRHGHNIIEMGRQVKAVIADYEKTLPEGVTIYRITDQSEVVSESIHTFIRELLIAVLSVLLVVVILMPMRVAYVSASTIPITIFSALALFFVFGIELNTVTLAALLVTLGMIVDDSIVIIDNYMEKMDEGMSRLQATLAAPREFFKSVLSATLAISITFFPFLFTTTGMFNDFLQSFPWAITIILGISLSVALLLVPFLQYTFIKHGVINREKGSEHHHKTFMDTLQKWYDKLLAQCFAHPYVTLSVGIGAVIAGAAMFLNLPMRLMPIAERNQFAVEFYLPTGTALERTAELADSLESILRKDKRVVSVTNFLGSGSPRFQTAYTPQLPGSNFAQFIVNTTGIHDTEDLLNEYTGKYSVYFPDAYVRFKQLDYSQARFPVEIRLKGDSLSVLYQAADSVMKVMHKDTRLSLVRTNFDEPLPGVHLRMDEIEAARLGLDKTLLMANMAIRFGDGLPVTTLWDGDYPIGIVLKSLDKEQPTFSDLPDEYIPVMGGVASVPLRQVAAMSPDWNPGQIVRRNGVRTISVLAETVRGYNTDRVTREVVSAIKKDVQFPEGVTMSVGGAKEVDDEALPQIMAGLGIAVCMIFFILLWHFKKISLALLTLCSTAMCLFGAALGMWIMGNDLSLTSILGVVSLIGILVRNGIIMFDYAEELQRDKGMSVRDAAQHAGMRRMRPIFLTSAAASMGVIPMILSRSALWSPMGTVICFGTLTTMVFISTVMPVAYWLIFRKDSAGAKEPATAAIADPAAQ